MTTQYIDESLANGLVKKWIRIVKELNERDRTPASKEKLSNLCLKVKTGIHKKKRNAHFKEIANEFGKAGAYIPYLHPSKYTKYQQSIGIILSIDVVGKPHKETLSITSILIDYKNNTVLEEIRDNEHGGFCVAFKSHHVFSRFIQRENREAFSEAIIRFYDCVINCRDKVERHQGPCNILLTNGGILLGDAHVTELGTHRFVAHTYIDRRKIMPHNFKNLFMPDIERAANKAEQKPLLELSESNLALAHQHDNNNIINGLMEYGLLQVTQNAY